MRADLPHPHRNMCIYMRVRGSMIPYLSVRLKTKDQLTQFKSPFKPPSGKKKRERKKYRKHCQSRLLPPWFCFQIRSNLYMHPRLCLLSPSNDTRIGRAYFVVGGAFPIDSRKPRSMGCACGHTGFIRTPVKRLSSLAKELFIRVNGRGFRRVQGLTQKAQMEVGEAFIFFLSGEKLASAVWWTPRHRPRHFPPVRRFRWTYGGVE